MFRNFIQTVAGVIIFIVVIAAFGSFIALVETQIFGGELTQLIIPRSFLALMLVFGVVIVMIVWEEYNSWKRRKLIRIARDLKRRKVYAQYLRDSRSAGIDNS